MTKSAAVFLIAMGIAQVEARAGSASETGAAKPSENAAAATPAASGPREPGNIALLKALREKGVLTAAEYEAIAASMMAGAQEPVEKAPVEKAEKPVEAPPTFRYKPGGGFTFETGDKRFATTLSGYLQIRSQYTDFDSDAGKDDEWRFQVRRARINVDGYIFENWVKYRLMIDAVGEDAVTSVTTTTDTDGNVTSVKTSKSRVTELKDGYLDIVPYEEFGVRTGQFKIPLSRQQIISASRLEIPDRSIADDAFAYGRDLGADLHGALSGRFFYDLGVYNGNGENHPSNPDGTDMAYSARAGVMVAGKDAKYLLEQEGDTRRSDDFALAFEVGDVYDTGDTEINTLELGGIMKTSGFAAEAAYFLRNVDPDGGASRDDDGYYAQVGYMFTDHIEAALRRSEVDLEDVTENTEHTVGLSYYFYEHNLKLQLAYSRLDTDPDAASKLTDHRVVLELSARF